MRRGKDLLAYNPKLHSLLHPTLFTSVYSSVANCA